MSHGWINVSTDAVDPASRDEYWREMLNPAYRVATLSGDKAAGGCSGSIRLHSFASMVVTEITSSPQLYLRDRRVIDQNGLSDYLVQLVLSGSIVADFGSTNMDIRPGDVFIIDYARPYRASTDRGTRLSVLVPRALLDRDLGAQATHGVVFRDTHAITTMLATYIRQLCALADRLSSDEATVIQQSFLALLTGSLRQDELHGRPHEKFMQRALKESLLAYIDLNLANSDLGPEHLAQRFRISQAHLYRILQADGGISRMIREKRLRRAYQLLVEERGNRRPLSITEVTYESGFSHPGHFSQLFKDRFGVTPREIRGEKPAPGLTSTQLDLPGLLAHFARYQPPKPAAAERAATG